MLTNWGTQDPPEPAYKIGGHSTNAVQLQWCSSFVPHYATMSIVHPCMSRFWASAIWQSSLKCLLLHKNNALLCDACDQSDTHGACSLTVLFGLILFLGTAQRTTSAIHETRKHQHARKLRDPRSPSTQNIPKLEATLQTLRSCTGEKPRRCFTVWLWSHGVTSTPSSGHRFRLPTFEPWQLDLEICDRRKIFLPTDSVSRSFQVVFGSLGCNLQRFVDRRSPPRSDSGASRQAPLRSWKPELAPGARQAVLGYV